ncbi:MAG TPA: acyltransferase family protein [Nocardioidaceae bacterium]|nr:acyltransferase family protein [Nocardioidaceae bacterium]
MSAVAPPASPSVVEIPQQRRRPTYRTFRPDIQGLRAVAVLLVVLYHAGVPFLSGGYVGVDVFFVISGFLITGQLSRELDRTGRISLTDFYARRFRRLLPPAALVVIATLAFARFVMPFSQLASLTKDAFWAAFYGINYHLAVEGVQYQAASAPPSPLQHFWSLAVEEQFYAVWPLLMILCAFVGRRRFRRPLLVAAITTLTIVTLYLSVTTTPTAGSMAYFGSHTRAWELGFGALLGLASAWVSDTMPLPLARALGWSGLAAILVSAVAFDDRTPFPGWAALVPVLGGVAVIAAGCRVAPRTVDSGFLSHGVMQYIGRTSYAWYLWHWPMLILLPIWWGHELNLGERLEVVIIAFWFAILTYFLEDASHRSAWKARQWLMAGSGLSISMVAATSLVTVLMPSVQGNGAAVQRFALAKAEISQVQAAVDRGITTKGVPSNLTPSLADAVNDYPWETKQQCHAPLTQTYSLQCVYGDKAGRRTAVLLGDSHAEQWLNALEESARRTGWRIVNLTKAACPVAHVPVWNQDLNRNYDECTVFQRHVDDYVREIQPDLIIASEADAVGGGQYSATAWAADTYSSLAKLAGQRSSIVYIGDSPYMTNEANACLERNMSDAERCIYQRNFNLKWTDMYNAIRFKMQDAGVGYINTRDFFCNQQVCPPIVDNMLTHRDQGHVTNTYAKWLAPMFAPIFKDAS